jgi:hypothetical protein
VIQAHPPQPPQQLAVFADQHPADEEDEIEELYTQERKRRKTESDAIDESSEEKFRERFDSIWDRKGNDDRKGSGASGAVSD